MAFRRYWYSYTYMNDLTLQDCVDMSIKLLGFVNLKVIYKKKHFVFKIYIIKNPESPLLGRNAKKLLELDITKVNTNNLIFTIFNCI